jgi:hypothetical protein
MIKRQKLEIVLNIIFGISSLIGCITTIVFTYFAYRNKANASYDEIIITLGTTTTIFTLVFVASSFYYIYKLSKTYTIEIENVILIDKIKNSEIIIKNTSEYLNNLSYYQRQILHKFDSFLEDKNKDEKGLKKITEDFMQFLSTFTSNLQSYFTLVTTDNCAITIKIVKDNKVKTFYRDSISYRSRKSSDINLDGSNFIYKISDNFAFHVITSSDYKAVSYFSNDLKSNKEYYNRNPLWKDLYNATAVVPISLNIGDCKSEMLGFLCVDNFNGNLSHKAIEGFLCSSSSLLYNIFSKFEKIVNFANQNNIKNGTVKYFNDWSYS